jgi:hypothetical protein
LINSRVPNVASQSRFFANEMPEACPSPLPRWQVIEMDTCTYHGSAPQGLGVKASKDRSGSFHTSVIKLPIDMFDYTRPFDRLSDSFTGGIVTDRRGQLLTCISG